MKTSLEPLHPFSFSSSQPVIVSTSWFQFLPPEYSQLLILSTSQSFILSSSHLLFPPVQHLALSHPLMSSTSQPPCSSSRHRLTFSYSHFPPSFQLLILSDSWFRNCPTSRLLTLFLSPPVVSATVGSKIRSFVWETIPNSLQQPSQGPCPPRSLIIIYKVKARPCLC